MERQSRIKPNILAILAFIIAVIGLFFPRPVPPNGIHNSSTLVDIRNNRLLRVGFEGYPPYTIQNPNDQTMSGYSVDLVNTIAEQAGWRVQWIKTSPDTKIIDLKAGKFDVMVEPIFATIARAKEVAFTQPYASFGYASAIVKKGDGRFKSFSDLNKEGLIVAVRQGYTDESYAKKQLPKALVRPMKVDDVNQIFLEVLSGKADVALTDTEDVKSFYKAHPKEVDTLFINPPPAQVPAGFIVREDDITLVDFFNTALNYLKANGVLDNLDAKYGVTEMRE